LRFSGARLDPDGISAILEVRPTKAWRKGERYHAGEHSGYLIGRTGTWFLATDDFVTSPDLARHLGFLVGLLISGREDQLRQLREVMARDSLTADISCFWHGKTGERPPALPVEMCEKLRALPAEIVTDFDTDETSPPKA
jgi:hypothetical protein